MSRQRSDSSISLFSFQDIIMAVVGIVLLIILLLILNIITQVETASTPDISERIESLENTRREIQEKIRRLSRDQKDVYSCVPSPSEIDALQTSIVRLEGDIEQIEQDTKRAITYHGEMKNRLEAIHLEEIDESIRKLEQSHYELSEHIEKLRNRNTEGTKREEELQSKLEALKKEQDNLRRQLIGDTAKKLLVTLHEEPGKIPHIVVYGEGTLTVYSQNNPSGRLFFHPQLFFTWVGRRNKDNEYFVLFVRPSRFEGPTGTDDYKIILGELQKKGFDVGLQVIGEKTEITLQPLLAP